MALEDILHDGLDEQESLSESASLVVEGMRSAIVKLIRDSDSVEDGLEAVAELVADKLADVTTDAVQRGAAFGARVVS